MSPTRRSGLGKGLSSLIPADVETDGSTFREINVDAVVPNRYQPRGHFDEETMSSLAASIAESAICSGVTGTCGDLLTVSPPPVTAQVMKTLGMVVSPVG